MWNQVKNVISFFLVYFLVFPVVLIVGLAFLIFVITPILIWDRKKSKNQLFKNNERPRIKT